MQLSHRNGQGFCFTELEETKARGQVAAILTLPGCPKFFPTPETAKKAAEGFNIFISTGGRSL